MSSWVDCKKQPPPSKIALLVFSRRRGIDIVYQLGFEKAFGEYKTNTGGSVKLKEVTHWMPLPDSPEVG